MGSLDEESTKFIVGEVVAALNAIHTAGFVYGDLKPENIVLTSTGHAKLTDFGAVRAYSAEATAQLVTARHTLRNMRNGDWKPGEKGPVDTGGDDDVSMEPAEGTADGAEVEAEVEVDEMLEGTAVYLAPEVVKGRGTSPAADCWALGCLVYQCIAGRPPVWAETEAEVSGVN